MDLFNRLITRHIPLLFAFCLLHSALPPQARALVVSGASLVNTTIVAETGLLKDTTVQFTLDGPADVQVQLANVSDPTTAVATFSQSGLAAGSHMLFVNGLWFLGGDFGRKDGTYQVTVAANDGTNTASTTANQLLQITSVDIHNVSVTPSFDTNQKATSPYILSYALAKDSLVTVKILDASGNPVRTLFAGQAQPAETTSTNTVTWDGLDTSGHPAPLGIYTITFDAQDSASGDKAIQRTRTTTVQSLAGAAVDPQRLFESNTYVYPNPVRNNQATFQLFPVRESPTITLKIYTVAGDLVWDKTFGGLTPGTPFQVNWNAVNQAGRNVGRGLYFYVVHEQDSVGTLQTTKKLAVIQ